MSRKKALPRIVLFVLRQFTDLILCTPLLLNWVISLIRYGDLRELVFPFLTSINCKDLVLFVLVET